MQRNKTPLILTPAPAWVWAGRVGSALTIAATLPLAIIHNPPMRWLFVAWTISDALWFWYGMKMGSGSLLSAQVVFLMIDAVAMTHYWLLGATQWHHLFG